MMVHVGISFRHKQILKWLIPILLGLGLLSFTDLAKADSYFIIDTENVEEITQCGRPLTDYIDFFNEHLTDMYNYVIMKRENDYWVTFIPNIYQNIYQYVYYPQTNYSGSGNISLYRFDDRNFTNSETTLFATSSFNLRFMSNKCNNTSLLDSDFAQAEFVYVMDNYSNMISNHNTILSEVNTTEFESSTLWSTLNADGNNNRYFSMNYNYNNRYDMLLYSSTPVIYKDSAPTWFSYWNNSYTVKPLKFNDTVLVNNEEVVISDYDTPEEKGFFTTNLGFPDTYLIIDKNNLNSFRVDYDFYAEDENYTTNHIYNVIQANGHKVNNNVYEFVSLSCQIGQVSYAIQTDGLIKMVATGITCDNIPNDITDISFKLSMWGVENNINNIVNDFGYKVKSTIIAEYINIGNYNLLGNVFFKYNAQNDYLMFLSSKEDNYSHYSSTISNNRWTMQAPYNLSTLTETDPKLNDWALNNQPKPIQGVFGSVLNRGLLITRDNTMSNDSTEINLFVDNSTYIYISNSLTQACYNYENAIICNNIIINYHTDNYDDYDIDYYFKNVSDYIDDLSDDILSFSNLIQNVYDTMPSMLQTTFFVLFILGNIYILLKLIRR